jgi:hypothetical protein
MTANFRLAPVRLSMETDLAAEIALQQFIWFPPSADTGSLLEAPINFLRTDTQEKLLFSIVN